MPLFSIGSTQASQLGVVSPTAGSEEVFLGTPAGMYGCATSGCSSTPMLVAGPGMELFWGSFALTPVIAYYSLTGNATGAPDGGLLPGAIYQVGLSGMGNLPFGGSSYPYLLALGGGYIFLTDDPVQGGGGENAASTVFVCFLAPPCNPTMPWITGIGHSYSLFADAANIYVLARDPTSTSPTATLYACVLPPETFSAAQACTGGAGAHPILTNVDVTSGTPSFASDSTNVYGTYAGSPGIVRVPVTGGSPDTLPTNGETPTSLTVDADGFVYWTATSGNVYRQLKDGSQPPQLLACGQASPGLITTDSSSVYFVDQGTDALVVKISKPSG
jgi:hypothetical protein